jgi:hypothetical protein
VRTTFLGIAIGQSKDEAALIIERVTPGVPDRKQTMKAYLSAAGVIVLLSGMAPVHAPPASMDQVAEGYVRLVLAVGEHDSDYVDAYYGPPAWKAEADSQKLSLGAIKAQASSLLTVLGTPPRRADQLTRLRFTYLQRQLQSLVARVEVLDGRRLTFDQESRALYDAVAPSYDEAHFRRVLDRLDRKLPGSGTLAERYETFEKGFVIPVDRLDPVFRRAISECRARTRKYITLPEDERFSVEFVAGKSWSAYNWYEGNNKSLIQVNTSLPIHIDRAIDLACHEGYPGHHVQNVLADSRLARERGWVEWTVAPLFSPQSLIAEGSANYGILMAFPGNERLRFEHDVLYPLAGLDSSKAAQYATVYGLVQELSYADNEAARRYLNGTITGDSAVRWLEEYALMSPARAKQRVGFFDQYRAYVINYNLGQDLVRRYVEAKAGPHATMTRKWEVFRDLIESPRLPSGLLTHYDVGFDGHAGTERAVGTAVPGDAQADGDAR